MAPSQTSNEAGLLAAYDAGSPMRVADLTRSGCRPRRTSPLGRPTVDAALWPTQTPSFGSVRLVLPGGVRAFVQVSTLDARLAHQPLHPFRPTRMSSRASIAWMRGAPMSARLLPDGLDTLGQSSISHRPCRRCAADTVIAGGHRFADCGELRRNPEGVSDLRSRLLLADENCLSPGGLSRSSVKRRG
jgi:hypothetical protein